MPHDYILIVFIIIPQVPWERRLREFFSLAPVINYELHEFY